MGEPASAFGVADDATRTDYGLLLTVNQVAKFTFNKFYFGSKNIPIDV